MRHCFAQKRSSHPNRRGWALFDTFLAISISGIMVASMGSVISDVHERQIAQSVASHINQVIPLAQDYLNRNYVALSPYIPIGGPAVLIPLSGSPTWNGIGDVATSSGRLPANWTNTLPSGQKLYLLARHYAANTPIINSPERLSAMLVTSGGSPMSDKQVGLTALMLGGMGGSITKNTYGSASAGQINGLAGSWSEQASTWSSGGTSITYGHVATFLTGSGGNATLSPYLDRYNIGNTEAQRMHTSIDMNSNDVNNIRTISGVNTLRSSNLSGDSATTAVNAYDGLNLCEDAALGCGLSISDNGGLFDEQDGWLTLRVTNTAQGLHITGNTLVDGSVGTNGYSALDGYPSGMAGGVHTLNTYAEGSAATGHNGSVNTLMSENGSVSASTFVQGQSLRPQLVVTDGQACSSVSAGSISGSTDSSPYTTQNGDIAKDADGKIMSCVDGVWKLTAPTVTEQLYISIRGGWGWTDSQTSTKSHALCALTQVSFDGSNNVCQVQQTSGGKWQISLNAGYNNVWGSATCTALCID